MSSALLKTLTAHALLAASLAVPVQASAAWREASTDHFVIYADASEKWLRGFAERLEMFDSGLRHMHGMPSSPAGRSNRLVIYVADSDAAVATLCGPGCRNVSGFYIPQVGGSVAFAPRRTYRGSPDFGSETVLFHEYTHHFLLSNTRLAHPRWLNEGIAELYSTAKVARDGSMCFGHAAQHRAYGLHEGPSLSMEALFEPERYKFSVGQAEVFYGRSWLLAHYLMFEPSRVGQLSNYANLFNSGETSLQAAQEAFGDLEQLEKDLNRYLARPTLQCRIVAAEYLSAGRIDMRTLGAGEAAMMKVRMRAASAPMRQQAESLAPDARRAARGYDDDAGVQAVLARIEYDDGHLAEADAAADRALAAGPDSLDALLCKGRVAVRRLVATRSDDLASWNAARTWFAKANRVDPYDAEPLYRFFRTFEQRGEPPSENAATALTRAFELSPQDDDLRWTYARHLLNHNRTAEARVVLLPLAYGPHRNGANPALAVVKAIDAGATGPEALKAISGDGSAVESQADPQ